MPYQSGLTGKNHTFPLFFSPAPPHFLLGALLPSPCALRPMPMSDKKFFPLPVLTPPPGLPSTASRGKNNSPFPCGIGRNQAQACQPAGTPVLPSWHTCPRPQADLCPPVTSPHAPTRHRGNSSARIRHAPRIPRISRAEEKKISTAAT